MHLGEVVAEEQLELGDVGRRVPDVAGVGVVQHRDEVAVMPCRSFTARGVRKLECAPSWCACRCFITVVTAAGAAFARTMR